MGFVFCVFLLFRFCFMVGPFSYALVKFRKFFITKNLIFIYNLNTIESFYYRERDFTTILVFLGFCHSPRKIAKEEENI
jgi:hypothetical protein